MGAAIPVVASEVLAGAGAGALVLVALADLGATYAGWTPVAARPALAVAAGAGLALVDEGPWLERFGSDPTRTGNRRSGATASHCGNGSAATRSRSSRRSSRPTRASVSRRETATPRRFW